MLFFAGVAFANDADVHSAELMEQAKTGFRVLFLFIAIPVAAGGVGIFWFIYKNTVAKKFRTTLQEDYIKEADLFEKAGKYCAAAGVYETKLEKPAKAASLYELGGNFRKAAAIYDYIGMSDKAKTLYVKAGDVKSAAQVSMMDGEFEDAAKIFDQAGKKLDAAIAMERAGRTMAAIKAYREAGEYRHASRLLEQEGMLKEAAEMFGFTLAGKEMNTDTIEEFYTYAFKLEQAGLKEKAVTVLREIDAVDPTYRDVREKLVQIGVSPEGADGLEGKVTLRAFIRSGALEPKDCLKLWVQILGTVQEATRQGRSFGLMSPDNILIDRSNKLSLREIQPSSAYTAPEKTKGVVLDDRADIYSLGVILFEMLTGSLKGLGTMSVIDIDPKLPFWLDEMVINCIRKVRDDRYQSIDEIFSEIKTLSQQKKQTGQVG